VTPVERLASKWLRRKQAGAVDFYTYGEGHDPKRVFSQLVDRAFHEHGHGGYTGSISEKDGFVLRSRTPMTREEAQAFAYKDIDHNDKYEPAFAVPVGEGHKVVGYLFYGMASS